MGKDLTPRKQVLSLRYLGYDVSEIAEITSLTVNQVNSHIAAIVTLSADATRVETVREAELVKLEMMENAFWPHISPTEPDQAPSVDAGKMVLSIMDRRSKLLGVDKVKPTEHNVSISLVSILAEISRNPVVPLPDQKVIDHA